ncbi:hypothetical protein PRIPAC_97757 [Pristionchus pacificus]|uniref:Uncharacterized protein n=1 Tax=Pristionchus pacificus TaxID=54126 RepID=A0A2A6D110_PRIPA|nr:hypothetical protein PRIPAC_97757 [Pristionchus pacificus]|eukprot:PDM84068.1 hypothetical protein PRIPAC_34260 [Pristionchus pacificus]
MNFLVFTFLLIAVVSAGVEDVFGGLGDKIEEKVDGIVEKTNVDNIMNSICDPDPERPLKTFHRSPRRSMKRGSPWLRFTLVSGVPKVIYDETVQEAINSFEQIKSDAANSITDIKIEMPKIPTEVDLGGGIVVPLS